MNYKNWKHITRHANNEYYDYDNGYECGIDKNNDDNGDENITSCSRIWNVHDVINIVNDIHNKDTNLNTTTINNEEPMSTSTTNISLTTIKQRMTSFTFWNHENVDYIFARDQVLLYLDKRTIYVHNVTIINVTLTDRCLDGYCNQRGSSSNDNEYIYTLIVRRLGRIVSYVYGLDDTIIINQLMYGIRR